MIYNNLSSHNTLIIKNLFLYLNLRNLNDHSYDRRNIPFNDIETYEKVSSCGGVLTPSPLPGYDSDVMCKKTYTATI